MDTQKLTEVVATKCGEIVFDHFNACTSAVCVNDARELIISILELCNSKERIMIIDDLVNNEFPDDFQRVISDDR